MRVSVIGAGYVGLVTGACLAKLHNEVTLIDIDMEKIEAIKKGRSLLYEEGLDELLSSSRLKASIDFGEIVSSEIIFICVGTPCNQDGSISLGQITEATEQISQVLRANKDYCVVVVKSTVVPGITEELVIPILEKSGKRVGHDFGVCMSPEFLREGKAVHDFMNPARVIIGEYDIKSGDVLSNLYCSLGVPILRTDLKTAEMTKLASNTFLATKVAFMNEIGNICKQLGIDVYKVAMGMGYDDRIGSKYLNAGIGFGGSCLPKDVNMLVAKAKQMGYKPRILEEVSNLNDRQALKLIELAKKYIPLEGSTVGVLGLAFKPGTDDIRNSRGIKVIEALVQEGAKVKAYDPLAMENFKRLFPQIEYVSKEEVMKCAAVLIVTEWAEFSELDYKGKIVIDGRRVPRAMQASIYEGICW